MVLQHMHGPLPSPNVATFRSYRRCLAVVELGALLIVPALTQAAAAPAAAPTRSLQGRPADTILQVPPLLQNARNPAISYRPLCPGDREQLAALHGAIFPIDYEDTFFQCAVRGLNDIFSWAAVLRDDGGGGGEQLVGFITARMVMLGSCDGLDRKLMGVDGMLLNQEKAVYILTLGTVEACRAQGIATDLLRLVMRHAVEQAARVVYLHVITYNRPAIAFYAANCFQQAALLHNFYCIGSGRQPDPSQTMYDAYLYVYRLACNPLLSRLMFQTVLAPLRSVAAQLSSCMPWAPSRSASRLVIDGGINANHE